MRASDTLRLAGVGLRFVARQALGRTPNPLIGGIAINDRCNLHCRQCSVSNRDIPDMTMDEIREGLAKLRALGIRALYIEGGEPFMWRGNGRGFEDVVAEARAAGFGPVIVYTNGTFPLETDADTVFVSLDGLRETNNKLRGPVYDRVLANIASSSHRNILVNFTVNRVNASEIEAFCREMSGVAQVRGIFFYFYTPGGDDSLALGVSERGAVVDRLIAAKAAGLPVRNSRAALRRFAGGEWRRPSDLCHLYAEHTLYRCCRSIGHPNVCEQCGYLGYAELDCIARLQPGAILEAAAALAGAGR